MRINAGRPMHSEEFQMRRQETGERASEIVNQVQLISVVAEGMGWLWKCERTHTHTHTHTPLASLHTRVPAAVWRGVLRWSICASDRVEARPQTLAPSYVATLKPHHWNLRGNGLWTGFISSLIQISQSSGSQARGRDPLGVTRYSNDDFHT